MMKINKNLKSHLALALLLCAACLLFTVRLEAADLKVRIEVENASVHLRADSSSAIIGSVPLNTILESEGLFGEWFQVKLPPNEEGFVVTGFIHHSQVEGLEEAKKLDEFLDLQKTPAQQAFTQKSPSSEPKLGSRSGFILRGALGYGPVVNMKSDEARLEISGGGIGAVISVGAFLNERLLVFGEVSGYTISDPKMSSGGYTVTATGSNANVSFLGAGLGYYLVPNSIYAAFTLAMSMMRLEVSGQEGSTDPGIGASLQIGKDFSLSQKVLLGVAGQASFGSMKDKNGGPRWNAYAVGVMATISWAPKGWK